MADTLAALIATLALPTDTIYHFTVATRRLVCPKRMLETKELTWPQSTSNLEIDGFSLIDYALHDILLDDPKEAAFIWRRSLRFYYDSIIKTLYRRSYDGVLLCCLSNSEAQEVLKETHDGICGAHQLGPNLRIDCTDLVTIDQPW